MNNDNICDHCGRRCGNLAGGYGFANKMNLCHPNDKDRPDCYKLVTLWGHGADCKPCKTNPALKQIKELRDKINIFDVNDPLAHRRAWTDHRILDLHAPEGTWGPDSFRCENCSRADHSCGCIGGVDDWPCNTVKALAYVYEIEFKEK